MSETTPGPSAVVSGTLDASKATPPLLASSSDLRQQPLSGPSQSSADPMPTEPIQQTKTGPADPQPISGAPDLATATAQPSPGAPAATPASDSGKQPQEQPQELRERTESLPSHSRTSSASAVPPIVPSPSPPRQTASPAVSPPTAADTTGDSLGNPLQDDGDEHKNVCANCGATQTPLWRRGHRGEVVCNACGLYLRARHTARPVNLKRPPRLRTVTSETGETAEGCLPGSCPGDGRCNGTGGSTACSQCPTFNNRVGKMRGTSPPAAGESVGSEPPKVKDEHDSQTLISCSNCGTVTTPLWRRDNDGNTICNACGLYYRLHHAHRPVNMTKSMIKRRKRNDRLPGEEFADPRASTQPSPPHPSHAQTPHASQSSQGPRGHQGSQLNTATQLGQPSPHLGASPGMPVDAMGRVLQPQQAHAPNALPHEPQLAQSQQNPHVPGPAQSLMALSQGFPNVYPMYNMYPMMVPPGGQGLVQPMRPGLPGQPVQGHTPASPRGPSVPPGPQAQQGAQNTVRGTASAATSPTLNREQAPGQFVDLPPPPVDFTYSFRRDNSVEALGTPQPQPQPPQRSQQPQQSQQPPQQQQQQQSQQQQQQQQQRAPVAGMRGGYSEDPQTYQQTYQSEHLIGGPAFAGPRGHVKRLSTSLPEHPSKRHALDVDSNSPLMVLKYLQGDSAKEYLLAARRHLQDKVEDHRKELSLAQRHLFECEEKLRELE